MRLTFLGANRQVTGSRYLLEAADKRILIDCGLFQERDYQDRNWKELDIPPSQIDAVLLTHAHLDHVGLLPRLVQHGFSGPIYATAPSVDLAQLVLSDSARLQAEDLAFKQARHERENRRSPYPYEPLYTQADVDTTLSLMRPVNYNQPLDLGKQLRIHWREAGHILGSASLDITAAEKQTPVRVVFSGDLGSWDKPIIRDPQILSHADYVIMESTYGDKNHDHSQTIESQLAHIINQTVSNSGNLIIPTFAIERAQELLFYLSRLLADNLIPHLMVFLDSPMAVDATSIFQHYASYLDSQTLQMLSEKHSPFKFPGLVLSRTQSQSKAINHIRGSAIIMAGAGMCTGGRIKHHLLHHLSHPENTILFVGYQSKGTLGRQILDGDKQVRILGQTVPVRAKIAQIHGMSAHADQSTLLRWLSALGTTPQHTIQPPKHVFLTHGEEDVALSLAKTIEQKLQWPVSVPSYRQTVVLD